MRSWQVFPGELVGLTVLASVYALLLVEPLPGGIVDAANVVGPIALVAILGTSILHAFRRLTFSIVAPAVWLRIAIAVYFGFGSVFVALVTGEVREYLQALYPFDGEMLLRLNMLNTAGTLAALIGIASVDWFFSAMASKRFDCRDLGGFSRSMAAARTGTAHFAPVRVPPRVRQSGWIYDWLEQPRTFRIGRLWLSVGLAWRLVVDLPNAFGLFEVIVPGAFGLLALARLAGYALLLAPRSRRWARVRSLVWLIWLADLSLGLATFAKTDTMLLGIAAVLAMGLRGMALRGLGMALLALFVAYAAVRPIVDYGRERVFERYGSLLGAPFWERMTYVGEALAGARARDVTTEGESWGWLLRFSYANAQAFVVSRYDQGSPGESGSLAYVVTLLVPRILWPDKPIVSDVGRDLYWLATGGEGTSIAPGVFAEAYWNGGWAFVGLWSGWMGVVVGILGRFSRFVLVEGRPWQLPVVFFAIVIATRPDGWFGLTFIGGAATLAVVAFLMNLIERSPRVGGARWLMPSTTLSNGGTRLRKAGAK